MPVNRTRKRADIQRSEVPAEFQNTGPTASEPQLNYLRGLREGKDLSSLTPEQRAWLDDADFDTFPSELPKLRMSTVIEQLKDLPWLPKGSRKVESKVDTGRYAVEKDDGTLMFYSVKVGYARVFVDVWASDARWPVNNPAEVKRILTAIENDPDAGPRFGREIGRCYVCGRTLTDETSRALGIGPVCRGDE